MPDSIPFALLFIFWMAGFISFGKYKTETQTESTKEGNQ